MALDASSRLLIGCDGGIYRSPDGGSTFSNLNARLGITELYPGVSGSTGDTLVAGSQDNGSVRDTGSLSWMDIGPGDGGFAAADPFDTHNVYISAISGSPEWVYKSVDGGDTATTMSQLSGPREFATPLVMDPLDPQRLYVGTDRLWTNYTGQDVAASWYQLSGAFTNGIASDFQTVYVGTSFGGLEVTHTADSPTTPLTDWTETSGNGLPVRYVTDAAVNPNDAMNAFATVSGFGTGHVFETTDGGGIWTDVSGNLPNAPANAIAVDPAATVGHAIADWTGLALHDSGTKAPGSVYEHTFAAAGTFGVRDAATGDTSTVKVPVAVSPASGTTASPFKIAWATASTSFGYVYDVQYELPGSTAWTNWSSFTGTRAIFGDGVTLGTAGTWHFRARVRNTVTGKNSGWSPATAVVVTQAAATASSGTASAPRVGHTIGPRA